ncbi:hypothetical protein SK128_019698 [Halocaridina rubra]|uniref:Uncharacterized protein n=1 Tax=Halocaridina rubra TaxID=373956 RepID=A0AAN9A9M0_HALRR
MCISTYIHTYTLDSVLRHELPFLLRARTVAFLRRTCLGRCNRFPEQGFLTIRQHPNSGPKAAFTSKWHVARGTPIENEHPKIYETFHTEVAFHVLRAVCVVFNWCAM